MRVYLFLFYFCCCFFEVSAIPQGIFYSWEGQFLGQIGNTSDVYVATSQSFQLLQNGNLGACIKVGTTRDLQYLAAVAFAETFPLADINERMGIVWAILNNNTAKRSDWRGQSETYAQTAARLGNVVRNKNPRFEEFMVEFPFVRSEDASLAVKAVISVLTGKTPDVSQKALFWEGGNALWHQAAWRNGKFNFGFEILKQHQLPRPIASRHCLEFGPDGMITFFRYQSTAVIGQTVFCRLHPDYLKYFHAPPY